MDTQSSTVTQVASLLRGMRVVDLSPLLERGIPNWPMHPPLVIDKAREIERDGYYLQLLMISEHTGTHVDAPNHFHRSMADVSIDQFPADTLIAPAVVYDFFDKDLKPGELITLAMVQAYEKKHGARVGKGEIALINFGWMQRYWRTDSQSTWFVTPNKSFADFTALNQLPEAKVQARVSFETYNTFGTDNSGADAEVTLTNTGDTLAFFMEMKIVGEKSQQSLTPVFWDDNYVSLPPHAAKVFHVRFPDGEPPELKLQGWNVKFENITTQRVNKL